MLRSDYICLIFVVMGQSVMGRYVAQRQRDMSAKANSIYLTARYAPKGARL